MRTRIAASTAIGVALVVLVAAAALAMSRLAWDKANDDSRVENDRAAQAAYDTLQASVGRVMTTLGAAAGLVNAQGDVQPSNFTAFARAVQSVRASDALALAKVVTGDGRPAFEAAFKRRITEVARPGVFRGAERRDTYLPIVAIWPETGPNSAFLGFDQLSQPARRSAVRRAEATRGTALTGRIRFASGRNGFLAVRPLYAPGEDSGDPVAFILTWFSTDVITGVLAQLPTDYEVGLSVDGRPLYRTDGYDGGGARRSMSIGGREWVVAARAGAPSHVSSLVILVGGLLLAALLGAFTWSRASSERRLMEANAAEREAHERSKLLERHASHLVAAATAADVAAATVADLSAAGVDVAVLHLVRDGRGATVATAGLPEGAEVAAPFRLDARAPGGDAWSTREIVELTTPEDYDRRYPQTADARAGAGIRSVIAVPLLDTEGTVVGVLVAASRTTERLAGMRLVVTGVAEQCGVALERARLRSVDDEARRRADILQRLVAALSAAALPTEVAEAAIPYLFEAFDADLCTVGVAAGDDVRTLKIPAGATAKDWRWRPVPLATSTPTADAMRARRVIEIHGGERISQLYPPDVEQLLRGIVSMLVVPLPRATGAVGVAFAEERILSDAERGMLDAVAEELTQALERSALLEGERNARLHAELMERNASRLAAAMTVADVAASTVSEFEAFGADVVFVWRLGGPSTLEVLGASSVPVETRSRFGKYPLDRSGIVAEAMRTGKVVGVSSGEEYDLRFPELAAERGRLGVESLVALPLRAASGDAVGAIFAASKHRRWLDDDRRKLLLGVAEQTGVALERATLFETEREARRLAELLERNAAHLAGAVTVRDVAVSTVDDLQEAGIGLSVVHVRSQEGIDVMAAATLSRDEVDRLPPAPIGGDSLAAGTLRAGVTLEVGSAAELEARFPGSAVLRRRLGVETILSVPLRATDRRVIGVLGVGSPPGQPFTAGRRQVILGVAEQCGLALERAQLQAEAARAAEDTSFLAALGESLERETTVATRARRLVEALTEARATFAAVHVLDEDVVPELVVSVGSRPPELLDDDRWLECVETAVATGREVAPGGQGSNGDAGLEPPSLVVLPLRARGHSLGALTVRIAAGADWRPVMSPALAREIAARGALAIDNAALYEREREVSHTLQLGLLGGGLPSFDGVVAAAAYRPGTATLEVGGDWYDAFQLGPGQIALVVGDVVGHGLDAAVAMGQLRGAVSALAQTAGPSELLERLDTFVETVPSAATATLAYVELDVETGRLRYACAGHPPPLVVSPDGSARFLWDGRSAPLGSMLGDERTEAVGELADGETIVLYTDGLVERRTAGIDAGLDRLARAARVQALGAPALADALCDILLDGESQDDDVCVLTVHRIPVASMFSHTFAAVPAELADLRERLRTWLEESGVETEVERGVVLAVSEAAANAIEHGYGCDGTGLVTVSARFDGARLDVTVRDEGTWRETRSDTDRGRGLSIMRAIVDDFSIERENGATVLHMSCEARETTSA